VCDCSHANEEILPVMPGFASSMDDEVVHTESSSSDHHTARQKLRKQLEKVTNDDVVPVQQGILSCCSSYNVLAICSRPAFSRHSIFLGTIILLLLCQTSSAHCASW